METWLSWMRQKLLSVESTRSVGPLSLGTAFWRSTYERSSYMETWLSGRKRLTANEVGSKHPPGFESLRLRKNGLRVRKGNQRGYAAKIGLGKYGVASQQTDSGRARRSARFCPCFVSKSI
jgi:hypothetical protein